MSTPKKLLFSLITVLMVFSLAELAAYVAGRIIGRIGVFYEPRPVEEESVADYLAKRDPLLGWPAPSDFPSQRYDRSGSRPIPSFPEPGRACVSIYGDSFTFGAGVSDEEAWSNQLSMLLGCRVANYGVGGYGSDQAVLRFEQNVDDEAPVVVLGHLSENILRNVNRYRPLIAAGGSWGLKPRFVLGNDGSLELLPIEISTVSDFLELADRPEAYPEGEYFTPGGSSGIQHMGFPYTLSMLNALRHYHVQAELQGLPAYNAFYEPDHPAQGLELTTRILARFARIARERGKLAMLQIIPTGLDLLEYQKTGRWIYAPLVERARELGIDVVDHGPRLMEIVGEGDPCGIYLRCNNHMNPLGNELLARQVARALDEREIRRIAAAQGRWPHEIVDVDALPAVAAPPPESEPLP